MAALAVSERAVAAESIYLITQQGDIEKDHDDILACVDCLTKMVCFAHTLLMCLLSVFFNCF